MIYTRYITWIYHISLQYIEKWSWYGQDYKYQLTNTVSTFMTCFLGGYIICVVCITSHSDIPGIEKWSWYGHETDMRHEASTFMTFMFLGGYIIYVEYITPHSDIYINMVVIWTWPKICILYTPEFFTLYQALTSREWSWVSLLYHAILTSNGCIPRTTTFPNWCRANTPSAIPAWLASPLVRRP